MTNELLLIASLLVIYGAVLLFYKLFGKTGLYVWTAFATVAANIEVLILVEAFGMEQTLGNILFASTFLVTDILSENCGREEAKTAVNLGIIVSLAFIVISQIWLLYDPCSNDWAHPSVVTLFTNTPRIMIASLLVYAIVQRFDVWLYHKIWELTENLTGSAKKLLWIRNNTATLIAQMLNTVLYTFGAFGNLYEFRTLISICAATYVIYIFTSLADTPAVYISRHIKPKA